MSYEIDQREYDQYWDKHRTQNPKLSSGYSENFVMGVGQTVDRFLTVSESYVRESGGWEYGTRDEELKALRESGEITDDEWMSFTRTYGRSNTKQTNYGELAQYANAKLGTEIQTNAEIDADMREGLLRRREMAEEVFNRQSGMGVVGEFAGGMTGYALEPLNAIALVAEPILLGRNAYLASQATTRLGRALVTARIAAGTGVATETLIQPFVFNWHENIGMDMTWSDALLNIAAVGVFSGGIGGAAGALTKPGADMSAKELSGVLKNLRKEAAKLVNDPEADGLLKEMERGLEGADKNVTAKEHLEGIDNAEKKYENKTVDAPAKDEVDFEYINQVDDDFDVLKSEGSFEDFSTVDLDIKALDDEAFLMKAGVNSNAIADIEHTANRIKAAKLCGIGN